MKFIDLSKTKQLGIFLIIIGTFVPSIFYPFTSLTSDAQIFSMVYATKGVAYNTRIKDLEIVLLKGEWIEIDEKWNQVSENVESHNEGRVAIPYAYIVAFGITLTFIGIATIALKKRSSNIMSIYPL